MTAPCEAGTQSSARRIGLTAKAEPALFRAGLGVIALHIADDSFLEPEPGTSARDHVVSGLVPLALFLLLMRAWPRMRDGLRGAVAIVLGLFGIIAGAAEGGYHTLHDGPSGDDYSGLVCLVGGAMLVIVGIVRVWKSRRLDEPLLRRYLRRALVAVGSAVVFFQIVFPILFAYGYTHAGRVLTPEAQLGTAYEDVSFETSDGLKLGGWYVPSRNGANVIVLPASGRSGPQEHARFLIRHGYGVLMFDPRGTGESEGDPARYGGERDVKAALAYLRARADVDPERIGGLGLSYGGELTLHAAGESDALKAVVSEGAGIRSTREQMLKSGFVRWVSMPYWAMSTAAIAVFSNHAPPPNLKDLVRRISPRPVFLMYSGHPVGGEELNEQFYAAAGEPKTLWKIADARHTGGLSAHPAEYERRVVSFFDRALRGGLEH